MYTCDVCGKEYDTLQQLGGHSICHKHQHTILTDTQRQVILGSLLGDMSISIYKDGWNPRLNISHSTTQKEYAMWKYSVLKNLIRTKPRIRFLGSGFGRESSKMYGRIDFETMAFPCLLPIHKLVRGDGKKHVSKSWLNEITDPMGLAVWYMDDGCLNNKSQITFYLGSMSFNECSTLQDWMINKWDISSHINDKLLLEYPNSIYYTMSVSSKSNLRKFKELVEPYIIPSVRYKIDKLSYLS